VRQSGLSGGIEGDYYGSGIMVRERVELAVKARGVGGCRCSSREFYGDRRDLIGGRFETRIDVDIGGGSRGSKCGRGARARTRRGKPARSNSSLMRFSVKRRSQRQGMDSPSIPLV
jgi:hypothetical protein